MWITLFAIACGGAPVEPSPVDTDVADTDEPGPCPRFAPEPCVAFDGVICTIDDPDKALGSWAGMWPGDTRDSRL